MSVVKYSFLLDYIPTQGELFTITANLFKEVRAN